MTFNSSVFSLRNLAALLLGLGMAATATAAGDVHPMRFDRLGLDEGLSQSAVVSIHQDARGFMWFGTENGLNRYDGYEFTHYRQERGNPDALKSDFIYDLGESPDGALWVATNGGGLSRYDSKTDTFRSFRHDAADPHSIGGNIVRTLLVDSDSSVWVGLRNAGLNRFDPASGRFERIELPGAASVYSLHKDANETLWIGADEGLYALDLASREVQAFHNDPDNAHSLSDNRVRAILSDSQGRLWVGTYDGGLNRYVADIGGFVHYTHVHDDARSLGHDRVTSLFEDGDGRLWVGTARGLNLYLEAGDEFVRYGNESGDRFTLSSDAVSDLFQDRSGLLWVGTLTAGVNKWNPRSWALGLQSSQSLAANEDDKPNVTSFATDAKGRVWIGTFGDGLIAKSRRDGSVTHYRHDANNPGSLADDRVMSLIVDRQGQVWAGTMRGGLSRLDPETGIAENYVHDPKNPSSLSANGIMAVFEDGDGRIWAGTFGGGVSIFDRKTASFTHISTADGLASSRVTSFAEDALGNIWIGTDAGGLSLYVRDSGQLHTFRYDSDDVASLSADTVYSLHVDADGTVWVGTRGGGLDRVVGKSDRPDSIRFANLSQRDGLSNDVVYGIQSNDRGELWLSTNYGITRVDLRSNTFTQLHRRHGLQSEEFNFGAHHASADGTLFFGGPEGFNEFEPNGLPVSKAIPPVMLTGFFNQGDEGESGLPPVLDEGVELGHRNNSVSFEFAALDYTAPESNRYMYKLEGFDRDWIDLGTDRRVTYTDLDDGYYLLRVKAASADGVWNEAGFSLPISVRPAPWDTWWAYLGYAALAVQLGLFLWWGHQRKLRREEEYSRRLEREVNRRTKELAERSDELVRLNQSLQESSLSDPLTGLRNRRFVFEEISRDLETISRKHTNTQRGLSADNAADLVFMMIDLDNFKPINDTFGHAAGDQMLLEIRDVLLSTCRRSDFVVRWGGDEFVVVAKQSHPGEAEALAERIRSEIAAKSFTLDDGQIVRTTCSIGFVAYPLYSGHSEKAGLDEVINLADNLMYEAKGQRNAWVGLLGVDEAATSAGFDSDNIEPSSILFRARRNGRLIEHSSDLRPVRSVGGAA